MPCLLTLGCLHFHRETLGPLMGRATFSHHGASSLQDRECHLPCSLREGHQLHEDRPLVTMLGIAWFEFSQSQEGCLRWIFPGTPLLPLHLPLFPELKRKVARGTGGPQGWRCSGRYLAGSVDRKMLSSWNRLFFSTGRRKAGYGRRAAEWPLVGRRYACLGNSEP